MQLLLIFCIFSLQFIIIKIHIFQNKLKTVLVLGYWFNKRFQTIRYYYQLTFLNASLSTLVRTVKLLTVVCEPENIFLSPFWFNSFMKFRILFFILTFFSSISYTSFFKLAIFSLCFDIIYAWWPISKLSSNWSV